MKINYKKYFRKGDPFTVTLIFAFFYLLVIFLFSDFFIKIVTSNTKIIYLFDTYRLPAYYVFSVLFVSRILTKQKQRFVQVDEVLKQTEDSYQILVENLKEDYFFYRHEQDKIFQNISPSIKTILGFSPNNFKENYKKYNADELVGEYIQRHKSLLESGLKPPPFEIEVLNAKGEKRILEVKEIPIINENNEITAVEGLVRDITDYRKYEVELKDKDTKFNLLYESVNDAVLILKGDKIIDCNQQTLKMFDCTIDKIIMQSLYSYKFSPTKQASGKSSRELARERIFDALKGKPQHYEWTHNKLNGDIFETEETLQRFTYEGEDFLFVIIKDITDKIKAEKALKQDVDCFKTMYDTSAIGLFRTKISDGTLIYINQPAAKLLGFTNNQEAIDKKFKTSTLYSKKRRQEMLDLLNKQGYVNNFEIHQKFENGEENYVSISAKIFPEKDYIEGIIYDITEKKLARLLLEEKEKTLNEVLNNSRAMLYKLDASNGTYSYISPSCYDILGYYPEEILKMSIDDQKALLHPDDQERAHSIIARLIASMPKSKSSYTVEYRLKHKNGNYKWLSDRYSIIKDEKEKTAFIIGNVIDITDEKESRFALHESELRFRNMAASIKNGVTIYENGKNVYVNDRMAEITGYSINELMTFSEFQISAPEEKKRLQKIVIDLQKSKTNIEEIEFWIIRKDGTRRCITNRYSYSYTDEGKEVKYIITSDITERKIMENTLRESEEKFKELANTLPYAIVEYDTSGKITYINKAGIQLFELSEDEVKNGFSIFKNIDPADLKKAKENFQKSIKGKKYKQSEYKIKLKGKTRTILPYPNLIYKDGKIVGIRTIVIDTTNQKRIEEELIIAKEAAKAANKAKSVFLTNLTHELRNPMNSIFGMTELIKKTALSDKQYDFLKVITESSENLLSILNDILVIPKIETGEIFFEKKPFKVQDILISVVGLVSYQAELKKLKIIETQNFDENLVALGDPSRLTQIFIDLAEYSIRNTAKGQLEAKIETIDENKDNITLEFSISDTSNGLPEKIIKALNEDFEKSHIDIYSEYGSYGLGLIVANKLISLLGSKLEIITNNNGVKFSFKLRLRKKDISELDKETTQTSGDKKTFLKNIRILLVEDELFNQLVIQSMIEEWDCEIEAVYTGHEALKKLEEKMYDIVLMDIMMPEMSGIETTKLIRKLPNDSVAKIPIVAITATTESSDHKELLQAGIDYSISKPFKSDELFHALVKGLGIKREEKKPVIKKEKHKEEKTDKLYDLKIIENIARNNKVLIVKMIKTFIDKSNIELAEMEKAITENNWDMVKNTAHKMKPAITYMGISNIDKHINFIHNNAKKQTKTEEVKETFYKLKKLLKNILDSMKKDISLYDNETK